MNEQKNVCPACSRKLMRWPYDHCMWCGEALPAELRLSAEEKSVIFQEREEARKEQGAAEHAKSSWAGGDGGSWIFDGGSSGGGDCGGDSGGGDCG